MPHLRSVSNPKANDVGWTIPALHAFCWLDSRRRRQDASFGVCCHSCPTPKHSVISDGRAAHCPASRPVLSYKEPEHSSSLPSHIVSTSNKPLSPPHITRIHSRRTSPSPTVRNFVSCPYHTYYIHAHSTRALVPSSQIFLQRTAQII